MHKFTSNNKFGISTCTNCGLVRKSFMYDKWNPNSVLYTYNVDDKWTEEIPVECRKRVFKEFKKKGAIAP